jgi:hypothetical protein
MRRSSVTVGLVYQFESVSMTIVDAQTHDCSYQSGSLSATIEHLRLLLLERKYQWVDIVVGVADGLLTRVVVSCREKIRRSQIKKIVQTKVDAMFSNSLDEVWFRYVVQPEVIIIYVVRCCVIKEVQQLVEMLPLRKKICLPCERVWECLPKSFRRPDVIAVRAEDTIYYCDTNDKGLVTTSISILEQKSDFDVDMRMEKITYIHAANFCNSNANLTVIDELTIAKQVIKLHAGYEMSMLLALGALRC